MKRGLIPEEFSNIKDENNYVNQIRDDQKNVKTNTENLKEKSQENIYHHMEIPEKIKSLNNEKKHIFNLLKNSNKDIYLQK